MLTDKERAARLFRSAEFGPYRVEHCEFWTDIEFRKGVKFCSPEEAADALRKIADWILERGSQGGSHTK